MTPFTEEEPKPAHTVAQAGEKAKLGPAASQALADRLQLLEIHVEDFSYAKFAIEVGVEFEKHETGKRGYRERLSRWLHHASAQPELLGAANYIKLVEALLNRYPSLKTFVRTPAMELLRNPLYHSLGTALNCHSHADVIEYFRRMVVGAYKIYRPSILQTDHTFIGRLDITYDAIANAFNTRERYEMQEGQDGEGKWYNWDMTGALFPMTEKVFMTVAVDPVDKTIQAKYFNNIYGKPKTLKSGDVKITGSLGWVADLNTTQYYTTRMYLESVDIDDNFKLEYIINEKVPRYIKNMFEPELSRTKNIWISHD